MNRLPDPQVTMEVSPAEVMQWIDEAPENRPRLIDCREEDELKLCQLPGNEWVPLGHFPYALESLAADPERGVVIYCHHGVRSLHAAGYLRSHGVEHAFSMSGGIDEWSRHIDPSVPRY